MKPTKLHELNNHVWHVMRDRIGIDNRITREDLCVLIFEKYTDYKDRQIRDAISELIEEGKPILSNSKTSGYWRYDPSNPEDRQEAEHTIRELHARGLSTLARGRALERTILAMTEPIQMTLLGE